MLCDTCQTAAHCNRHGRICDTPEVTISVTSKVEDVLNERGKRYGRFIDVATATDDLQTAFYDHMNLEKLKSLSPDQSIAIDMICHKLARIAVGDHNYIDNWLDIAGYAQLVVDGLKGNYR